MRDDVTGKLPSPLSKKSNLKPAATVRCVSNTPQSSQFFYSLIQLQSLYEWLDACHKWLLWTGILSSTLKNSSVFDSCCARHSFALRWSCVIFTKEEYVQFFLSYQGDTSQRSASSQFLVNILNGDMHLSSSSFPLCPSCLLKLLLIKKCCWVSLIWKLQVLCWEGEEW